jgi:riboflavin biosynthesis pyrimidine reductase
LFDRLHKRLGGDAWLVGRVTGQEYARLDAYPDDTDESYPRELWFARRGAAAYGVVLDAHGKIAWGHAEIGGDPIVTVLTERVSDAHLAGLRKDGVSYIFAGEHQVDLGLALGILNRELGIKRLLLEGGGNANGPFFARASSTRSASQFFRPSTAPKARHACSIHATSKRARQLRSAR